MTEAAEVKRSTSSQSWGRTTPSSPPCASTTQTAPWLRRSTRWSRSSTVSCGPTVRAVSATGWAAFTRRTTSRITSAGMSCGRIPRPPRRAMVSTIRRPVTAVMLAETRGMVAPVPSSGAMSTSMRLATSECEGTRKTSLYVRSTAGSVRKRMASVSQTRRTP